MRSHWQPTGGCKAGVGRASSGWLQGRNYWQWLRPAPVCSANRANLQVTVLLLLCPLLSAMQRPACALHFAVDRLL